MARRYYSSNDCIIYINGIEATELFSVSVSETEQVLPIYGWRSRHWDTITSGNVLVTGSILYNGLIPNYLESLLAGKTPVTKFSSPNKLVSNIQDKLIAISEAIKLDNLGTIDQNVLEIARLNKKYLFNKELPKLDFNPEDNKQNIVDIEIQSQSYTDTIHSARFTGIATEINGGVANNIKYARSFVAKQITQL